jgi:2-polyprenyl-3-methyl-5-hydroxy-6-metoxy-1,4-benzoquinol methylase
MQDKSKVQTYYSNIRKDVIRILPELPIATILEIGGGQFDTLLNAKEKYTAEAWGVDIYNNAPEQIKYIKGAFTTSDVYNALENGYFDLIIANDVLEHIADENLFFSHVNDKLSAKGYLALSVPNIRQLRSFFWIFVRGTFPRNDAGLFDRTHLRWFCRKDILHLARKNGFEVEICISVGRLVPKFLQKTLIAEFFALQNIFLLKKN